MDGIGAKVWPSARLNGSVLGTQRHPPAWVRPLTESPGRCQVHEPVHTGKSMRASTTVCCANARARKDDGLGGAASGAGQRTVRRMTRPRGTSGGKAPASHVQLYVGNNARHGLGGPCRARLIGQAMGRRVTTATPFAPPWSRPGGLGKLQLTPAADERQRLFAAYLCNAPEMAVVSGGACNRNDGGKYLSNAHATETKSRLDSH